MSNFKKKIQMSNVFRALTLTALALLLSGCVGFGVGESGTSPAAGEFLKGALAKGFPGVPGYPKARLGESYGDGKSWGAYSVTGDKLEKVVKYYGEILGKTGWERELAQLSQNRYVYEIRNAKYQGTIVVNTAADTESTAITVSLTARTP